MTDLLREQFRYHSWATLALIGHCKQFPLAMLQEKVAGTDRPILHTLTHIVGTEEEYLEVLTGKPAADRIRAGEVLSLDDLQRHCEKLASRWEASLDHVPHLDITLPADEERPETPHGQNLLVVQTIQHGIDHRTQICTTLSVLGLKPASIDGWSYWTAVHESAGRSRSTS